MNFQIFLRKNNLPSAIIAIELLKDEHMIHYDHFSMIENEIKKTFAIEPSVYDQYTLKISRHELDLYQTDKMIHDSHVIVDKIVLDDFWTIDDKNHWSKTIYDPEYVAHLKDKEVTWELSKDLHNNILYFNGSLDYKISIPIRGMFFK